MFVDGITITFASIIDAPALSLQPGAGSQLGISVLAPLMIFLTTLMLR